MNAPMLVDFQKGGETEGIFHPSAQWLPLLAQRDTDGGISYLDAEGLRPAERLQSIDPKTGRPDVDLAHKPATGKTALFCPGLGAARTGRSILRSNTGMVYIPSNENHCNNLKAKSRSGLPPQWWTGRRDPGLSFPSIQSRVSSASCNL